MVNTYVSIAMDMSLTTAELLLPLCELLQGGLPRRAESCGAATDIIVSALPLRIEQRLSSPVTEAHLGQELPKNNPQTVNVCREAVRLR